MLQIFPTFKHAKDFHHLLFKFSFTAFAAFFCTRTHGLVFLGCKGGGACVLNKIVHSQKLENQIGGSLTRCDMRTLDHYLNESRGRIGEHLSDGIKWVELLVLASIGHEPARAEP